MVLCVIDIVVLILVQLYSKQTYRGLLITVMKPLLLFFMVAYCAFLLPNGIPLFDSSDRFARFNATDYCEITSDYYTLGEDIGFMEGEFDDFAVGTYTCYYYAENYEYWSERKAELEKEIEELSIEVLSGADYQEALEKIKELENDIKIIDSNLDNFKNEYIKVTTNRWVENGYYYHNDLIEAVYNACASNTEKWNDKENAKLFYEQSITLTQTEFAVGTDFSKTKVGATISYYDGSFKKAYIPTESLKKIDTTERGTHLLQWSDSWGSYEYQITII